MPHYADGTPARVGDQVTGKLYNTPGIRAGTIISITPGTESCNAMVGFLVPVAVRDEYEERRLIQSTNSIEAGCAHRMLIREKTDRAYWQVRGRPIRAEAHGSAGDRFVLIECADYCDVKGLTKVGP